MISSLASDRKQMNNLNSREVSEILKSLRYINLPALHNTRLRILVTTWNKLELSDSLTSKLVYDCFKDVALARRLRNIPQQHATKLWTITRSCNGTY